MEAAAPPKPASDRKPDEPDLPGEGEGDDEIEEPVVEGSESQLSLAIGGRKPEESRITLAGGAFKMSGQFKKGERVRLFVEGTVDEVATRDNRDRKLNLITSTTRTHTLTVEKIDTV